MKKQSAGILLYKKTETNIEVLLAHPGGPYWAKKDSGSWSIPKGEFEDSEQPLDAAKREFSEELGMILPEGELHALGEVKQKSGKVIYAWASEADLDVTTVKSNSFEVEWPPKSGQMQQFPEVDKVAWFSLKAALKKIVPGQAVFLERLAEKHGITVTNPVDTHEQTTLF